MALEPETGLTSERPAPRRAKTSRFGLSSKLLLLTVLFVMLAEVLIYVPSIANFRLNWLNDRVAAARTAALVLDAAPSGMVPESLAKQVLQSIGAQAVAVKMGTQRRLLAAADVPSRDRSGHRHAQHAVVARRRRRLRYAAVLQAGRRHPGGRAGADGRRLPRNRPR